MNLEFSSRAVLLDRVRFAGISSLSRSVLISQPCSQTNYGESLLRESRRRENFSRVNEIFA